MRILICPLDWGLGHATRCIPIIRSLHANGHEVFVAASGAGFRLLQPEFPGLTIREIPSYTMQYTQNPIVLPFFLLAQLPLFLFSMWRDKRQAQALVVQHGIERIISDGRYGIHVKHIPTIFITHQLQIIPPGPAWLKTLLSIPLKHLNHLALKRFHEIWVPDFPGEKNLSGLLGHAPISQRIKFIGPLCRFRPDNLAWDQMYRPEITGIPIDVLALISGPEPQRTLFENKLLKALEAETGTRVLVRGLPGVSGGTHTITTGKLHVFDHLDQTRLLSALTHAKRIICRSGYTSVMELAGLGITQVVMIPTPGQPEQEYLARHLNALGIVQIQTQDQLSLTQVNSIGTLGFMTFSQSQSDAVPPLSVFLKTHPLLSVL